MANESTQTERLVRGKDVAAVVGVCPHTIWRWGRAGKIETHRVGHTIRYSLSEVLAAIRSNSTKGA